MCKCDGTELMPCTCSLAGAPAKPTTPHVHAELIKAWADGAEIQVYNQNLKCWQTVSSEYLGWRHEAQYRIKPEPKKLPYRLAIVQAGYVVVCTSIHNASNWSQQSWFKKWITPWQYYIEEEA